MPSRLETLLSDLAVYQVEDIDVDVIKDLLAVAEAARKRVRVGGHPEDRTGCYYAHFQKGNKGCPCGLDDMREALAKLDEVQPVAGCRYKQPPGKPCVELCSVCADIRDRGLDNSNEVQP